MEKWCKGSVKDLKNQQEKCGKMVQRERKGMIKGREQD